MPPKIFFPDFPDKETLLTISTRKTQNEIKQAESNQLSFRKISKSQKGAQT